MQAARSATRLCANTIQECRGKAKGREHCYKRQYALNHTATVMRTSAGWSCRRRAVPGAYTRRMMRPWMPCRPRHTSAQPCVALLALSVMPAMGRIARPTSAFSRPKSTPRTPEARQPAAGSLPRPAIAASRPCEQCVVVQKKLAASAAALHAGISLRDQTKGRAITQGSDHSQAET